MLNKDLFKDVLKCVIKNSDGKSSFSFTPEHGATIIEVDLICNNKQFSILDGFKSAEQLHANEKSRNIWLLPFPNRVKDGRFVFEGKEYFLPVNKPKENNAIHGFIWNKGFKLLQNDNSVTLEHRYKGDYPGFPFPFSVSLDYELSKESLSIKITVINTGKSNMPFGMGWHPYFTFRKPIDFLQLQLPSCSILETDDRLIPTGKRNSFKEFDTFQTIGSMNFDHAFEFTGAEKPFETKLHDPECGQTIIVEQDPSFKYLQIFTPPDRNSIALEPMTCPANAFNSGEGLKVLKVGESFQGKIKLRLGR